MKALVYYYNSDTRKSEQYICDDVEALWRTFATTYRYYTVRAGDLLLAGRSEWWYAYEDAFSAYLPGREICRYKVDYEDTAAYSGWLKEHDDDPSLFGDADYMNPETHYPNE